MNHEQEEVQHDISKLQDQVQQISLSQRITRNEIDGLKSVESNMDGFKKGIKSKMVSLNIVMEAKMDDVEANMDGVEAKMDGIEGNIEAQMDGLKKGVEGNMDGIEGNTEDLKKTWKV